MMFPRRLEITASAGHERRYAFFQDGQVVPRHSRRNAEELASARSVGLLAGLSVFGNGLRSRRASGGSGGQRRSTTAFGAVVWTRITVLESAF